GDSQIVTVAFTPQAAETYTDSIIITSDATEANTLSVGLSGTGITALAGDIDNSGRVDIFDLLELLKGLGKGSTARKADVNTDGQVNIFDLLALLKLLSGG
ncbi:MAG TPA: dockerin type I domain-containing protein, partial [archaeon]|nr:dockerin type I domain-containing protein [archaeon]